ncbi:MAG: UvrD-helicase domain-containing protein [Bacteroidaceae bacterium]
MDSSELVVYKASAGSGKTFTLAVEYIRLLLADPRAYRNILAVTFTNKATGEMKERILSQLWGIAHADPASEPYLAHLRGRLPLADEHLREAARTALDNILHDYSRFRVETIDSFFQSVMRSLARELEQNAGLDLSLDSQEALSDAVDALIEKLTPRSPVLSWLLEQINERISQDRNWNVAGEIKSFGSHIFDETYLEHGGALREKLNDPDFIPRYRKLLLALQTDVLEQMKGFSDQFYGLLETAGLSPSDLNRGDKGIGSYFRKISQGDLDEKVRNKTVQDCLESAEAWSNKTTKLRPAILRLAESDLVPLLQTCEEFRQKNLPVLNSCTLSLKHLDSLRLLGRIDQELHLQNYEQNRFLLSETNALLHTLIREGDSSFVFEKIGAAIRHVMIDEFQDTSHLQWDNFRMLLLEGLSQGHDSLVVGDVKQSIYRWRGADWSILNRLEGHIGPFPIRQETLGTNRRSEARIIRFNNGFFPAAVDYINTLYADTIGTQNADLRQAYADVCQASPRQEERGFVEVSVVRAESQAEYVEQAVRSLADQVRRLLEAGVRPADMAILVRKRKEIAPIAAYFEQNLPDYPLVSDEAFRLDASPALGLLVDALRCFVSPDHAIARARLAVGYRQWVLGANPAEAADVLLHGAETYLPDAYLRDAAALRRMPLYELLHRLADLFQLSRIPQQEGYLCTFFDGVLDYLKREPAEPCAFLRHWDEKLCSQTIPAGEVAGLRILTIHTSKGLEFHTVLIPFCDWKLENERPVQVWCQTDQPPFDQLDLIPVDYGKSMEQSVYRADYRHEQLQLLVDNLNLLYVAFTRAEKNLLVQTRPGREGTVADVLTHAIAATWEWDGETPFVQGDIVPSTDGKSAAHGVNPLLRVPGRLSAVPEAGGHRLHFRQSNRSHRFLHPGAADSERYIDQGILLHTLFSAIQKRGDEIEAIERLVREGVISSSSEAARLQHLVEKALSHPEVASWFDGTYQVMSEREIAYLENDVVHTCRPDRVMTCAGRALVVDFKFGTPRPEHQEQVRTYVSLLDRMGYTSVEGRLWYVYQGLVESV